MEYYVEKIGTQQTPLFQCHSQYNEHIGITAKSHIHDWVELLYCTAGNMSVELDKTSHPFCQGDLVIVPSYEVHKIVALTQEHHEYIVIKFNPLLLYSNICSGAEYSSILPFFVPNNVFNRLFSANQTSISNIGQLCTQMLNEYEAADYGYETALKHYIYGIIMWILRQWQKNGITNGNAITTEQVQRLQKVFAYVQQNYNMPITINNMAKLCNVSYSYFSRFFSAMTGRSFMDYLCSVRLMASEHLLATTQLSITEIAFETGFADASYFTRRFTAKNAMSPTEYRRQYIGH